MNKTKRKTYTKRNKTCKVTQIPTSDKDIKAIIDVNAIKNNVNFLKKKTGLECLY
jgi:hypothetical protein